MASVNKVFLVGNLGADPEVRFTPSGQAVANFRIATTDVWNDKSGERQERTEWHRIVVWGKQAEHCKEYLRKGRSVHVEGRLQTREWEDKTTNQKRYQTEIVADRVTFLGGNRDAASGGYERNASSSGSGSSGYTNNGYGNRGASGGNTEQAPDMDAAPPLDDSDIPF